MARDPKFYAELKQLNEDFAKFIDETLKKSPYFNLSPTLNDYIRQFNSLEKQFPAKNESISSTTTTTTAANKFNQAPAAPSGGGGGFTFGSSMFAPASTTTTSSSSSAVTFGAAPTATSLANSSAGGWSAPQNSFTLGSNGPPAQSKTSPPRMTPFAPMTPFSAPNSSAGAPATSTTPPMTTAGATSTTTFAPLFSSTSSTVNKTTTSTTTATTTTNQPFVFGIPSTLNTSGTTQPTAIGGAASNTSSSSFFSFNLAKKDDSVNSTTAATTTAPSITPFTFNPTPAPTNNDNTTTNQQNTDGDDDAPPPEPNVEKYEEPNAKFQIRCKLYERNPASTTGAGAPAVSLLGFGVLFVKEMETPNKLQVIFRQDPDLRRVLLNEVVTHNIPLKLLPKAIQMIVPGPSGESKIYVAKVKDEKTAEHLHELLNSPKTYV